MRAMTSEQIHRAIGAAIREVAHGLASGDLDRSGRYYSDSELMRRRGVASITRDRRRSRDHNFHPTRAKSA